MPGGNTTRDGNFVPGGSIGIIEQLDLTTKWPQTVAILDGSGNQITTFGGGTQYADAAARGSATGTLAMGDDGTNIQSIHVDSSGDLQVDVLTMPTVAVTGTFWQATQPISGAVTNTVLSVVGAGAAATAQRVQLSDESLAALENITVISSGTVTNAGTFVVQENGAALTSLQLIDNAISGAGFNTTQLGGVNVSLNTGVRDAGTQRVTIATNDVVPVSQSGTWDEVGINDSGNSITVDGTITEASGAGILTSVQLIDDAIFTAGTSTYTEATSKGELSLAVRRDADTTLVDTTNEMTPLQVNAGGQLKVAVIAALPAGSAAIGKLAANSGVDIGDVDVTSAIITSGTITTVSTVTNLSQLGGAAVPIGAGTEAAAIRVTLPTNGTGIVGLAAGTNGIGKLTSNSGVTIGAVEIAAAQTLATVSTVTNLAQMNGAAISMGNGISGTGVQRVTLASDSTGQVALATGSNTIGSLTANQSVNNAQIAGATISTGVGATGTGTQRVVQANDMGRTLASKGGSVASSGDNTLVSAGTNRLKVYAFSLSTTSSTAVTCIFQSGASGTELWRVILQAPASVSTGANLVVQPPAWLFATASATLLNLNLSGAITVHYSVSYYDEV